MRLWKSEFQYLEAIKVKSVEFESTGDIWIISIHLQLYLYFGKADIIIDLLYSESTEVFSIYPGISSPKRQQDLTAIGMTLVKSFTAELKIYSIIPY